MKARAAHGSCQGDYVHPTSQEILIDDSRQRSNRRARTEERVDKKCRLQLDKLGVSSNRGGLPVVYFTSTLLCSCLFYLVALVTSLRRVKCLHDVW